MLIIKQLLYCLFLPFPPIFQKQSKISYTSPNCLPLTPFLVDSGTGSGKNREVPQGITAMPHMLSQQKFLGLVNKQQETSCLPLKADREMCCRCGIGGSPDLRRSHLQPRALLYYRAQNQTSSSPHLNKCPSCPSLNPNKANH